MLFNEKLKELRKSKKLTQEELAEKLNVSRQAITKWESGEGIPDIENLKQISILFNTTIDELVKEEKNIDINNSNNYVKELEIDHSKHFDININKCNIINLKSTDIETVKVEIITNEENIDKLFKIKFDDLYNKLDIDIKNKSNNDSIINIYIPNKYIEDIELKSKAKELNLNSIDVVKLEYDGSLKYLNVNSSSGNIVLNASKCDVEAKYDKFEGLLEVNMVNSTTRVYIPKNTEYKTVLKGIRNKFIDDNSKEESKNIIELNGFNSKVIIIEE